MCRSLFIALATLLVWTFPSRGDEGLIVGPWQQIESNAGACPKCRISIEPHRTTLTVTANNGWAATVVTEEKDGSIKATGIGNWRSSLKGAMAGKRFRIDFVLMDQRLYMSMLVDMGNGSKQTIRGIFGRVWFGV
jgi:hypothetical protein